ncbi:hypothetical protein H4582DRAFT_1929254 [Lactarius indigo]|nr:hypothetical protein H4582DRAFT_1929254 [Lactarius indigo]
MQCTLHLTLQDNGATLSLPTTAASTTSLLHTLVHGDIPNKDARPPQCRLAACKPCRDPMPSYLGPTNLDKFFFFFFSFNVELVQDLSPCLPTTTPPMAIHDTAATHPTATLPHIGHSHDHVTALTYPVLIVVSCTLISYNILLLFGCNYN